jgi:hypothetical protein
MLDRKRSATENEGALPQAISALTPEQATRTRSLGHLGDADVNSSSLPAFPVFKPSKGAAMPLSRSEQDLKNAGRPHGSRGARTAKERYLAALERKSYSKAVARHVSSAAGYTQPAPAKCARSTAACTSFHSTLLTPCARPATTSRDTSPTWSPS